MIFYSDQYPFYGFYFVGEGKIFIQCNGIALFFAVAANAFYNQVHFGRAEIFRQHDFGNLCVGQAKSLFANRAVKMHMQVVVLAGIAIIGAQGIFG